MARFTAGDATDSALCIAIHHEFLRCDEAFKEFASSAETMIMQGSDRRLSYKTYNAYARFVHHLYEFAMGAVQRDLSETDPLKHPTHKPHEMADKYINGIVQRILTNKREAILSGNAEPWENHISAYPEKIPDGFAQDFRRLRNTASGHVKHQRTHLSMSKFYEENHKFLYLLYTNSLRMWGTIGDKFPSLGEITAFSVMLREQPPR